MRQKQREKKMGWVTYEESSNRQLPTLELREIGTDKHRWSESVEQSEKWTSMLLGGHNSNSSNND